MSRQHSVRKMVKDAERCTPTASVADVAGVGARYPPETRPPARYGSAGPRLLPRNLIPSSVRAAVTTLYSRLKNSKSASALKPEEEHFYDNIPARMAIRVAPTPAKSTPASDDPAATPQIHLAIAEPPQSRPQYTDDMVYGRHGPTDDMIGERYAVRTPNRDTHLTLLKRRTRKGRSGSVKDNKDKQCRVENVYTKEPRVVGTIVTIKSYW